VSVKTLLCVLLEGVLLGFICMHDGLPELSILEDNLDARSESTRLYIKSTNKIIASGLEASKDVCSDLGPLSCICRVSRTPATPCRGGGPANKS
jgi:hypothetical protein